MIIDAYDFQKISELRWRSLKGPSGTVYAVAHYNKKTIFLHNLLMGPPVGMQVDHIDRNGLNNQRYNLRLGSPSQNMANRSVKTGQTGFRGVRFHSRGHYIGATITVKSRHLWLGSFSSVEEAARAYDAAAIFHFGEFTTLNYPGEVAQ